MAATTTITITAVIPHLSASGVGLTAANFNDVVEELKRILALKFQNAYPNAKQVVNVTCTVA